MGNKPRSTARFCKVADDDVIEFIIIDDPAVPTNYSEEELRKWFEPMPSILDKAKKKI